MKEIIQSILPVISAFLGAGFTFYFQKKLMGKQLEVKKEIIKFEKKREALAELKSYQITIVNELTSLKTLTKNFSEKKIDEGTYKQSTKHNIAFLEDILSKAYTLHNKQLDFYVVGLTVLYRNIEHFLKNNIQNYEYNITEEIDYIIKNYDYYINESNSLLKKIEKIAREENL